MDEKLQRKDCGGMSVASLDMCRARSAIPKASIICPLLKPPSKPSGRYGSNSIGVGLEGAACRIFELV